MNGIRCPNCSLVNLLTAESCHRCGNSLADLPPTAQVSVPVEETFQARSFANPDRFAIPEDNETGRKTYMWYRIYCLVMVLIYALCIGLGIMLAFVVPPDANSSQQENLLVGLVYMVIGLVFGAVFMIAIFLPRKSFNWIVGIVMIAIGSTSCCFLPATIPLLIFWLKPETQAYFGRK